MNQREGEGEDEGDGEGEGKDKGEVEGEVKGGGKDEGEGESEGEVRLGCESALRRGGGRGLGSDPASVRVGRRVSGSESALG